MIFVCSMLSFIEFKGTCHFSLEKIVTLNLVRKIQNLKTKNKSKRRTVVHLFQVLKKPPQTSLPTNTSIQKQSGGN